MTQDLLVTAGEEFFVTENTDGVTLTVGLYDDSTDNLGEDGVVDDITSEPTNDNYSTQTSPFSASNIDGNWGISNDTLISFDFSDTTDQSMEVDTAFVLASFNSEELGSTGDHLIANPSLSQLRKVGSIDTLEISVGDAELLLE